MSDRREYLSQIARLTQSWGYVPIGVMTKHPRFKNWQNVRYNPEKNICRLTHLYDAGLVDSTGCT